MPPQHVEVAETIAALKRALRREKEAPTDQPISAATNRGNKLKSGASHVHAGTLPYGYGSEGYKQKIDHAGYTRYILDRNPRRYNDIGDELGDSESDTEADEYAEEENPYSNVHIEELLRPIQHPSELATHPTLSLPFLDPALPEMLRSTEEKLRQEKANLWRAKNLNRHFIGDESWMPLGAVEGPDDWDLFEPKPRGSTDFPRRKRKKVSHHQIPHNGINGHDYAIDDDLHRNLDPANLPTQGTRDAPRKGKTSREKAPGQLTQPPLRGDTTTSATGATATNGMHEVDDSKEGNRDSDDNEKLDSRHDQDPDIRNAGRHATQVLSPEASEDGTPPPTRRITRALAAEREDSVITSASPQSTASSVDSSLLQPDRFFLLPPSFSAAHRGPLHLARVGLPIEEFIETRRLLTMYIQKQEESVRGYEAFLGKLTRAKRMRDKVWESCKAEGHIGEWSDGEDWIDAEAWGLEPDELKKGKDDEDVEGQEDTGRKGKRRRRD